MTRAGIDARPPVEVDGTSAVEWMQQHLRQIAIGIALAAIIAALAGGYLRWRTSRIEQADQALAKAEQSVFSGNAALAQADLRGVISRYGGTPAELEARMLLAQVFFGDGKPVDGLKALEGAGSVPDAARPAVLGLIAAGYEQEGKFDEAAKQYLAAASAARSRSDRDRLRADAARVLTLGNQPTRAAQLWRDMATDPASSMAPEARVRLGELESRAAGRG